MVLFRLSLLIACIFLSEGHFAEAKVFENEIFQMEIPEDWNCRHFGYDWHCHSQIDARAKEAQVVVSLRLSTREDSIQRSQREFSKPIVTGTGPYKMKNFSRVIYSDLNKINPKTPEDLWSDALHIDSEEDGYVNRYLTIAKSELFVLVTITSRKETQLDYGEVLERLPKTLVVFRKPSPDCLGNGGAGFDYSDSLPPKSYLMHNNDKEWNLLRWLGI